MNGEAIIAIIMGAVLASFSLVMVGYSFFRGEGPDMPGPHTTNSPDEVSVEPPSQGVGLDSILDSIDTLELEFQLGNLPYDQYQAQMQGYRLEAATAIKAQVESGTAPPELLLELEVAGVRSRLALEAPSEAWGACSRCDAPVPMGGAPCPHCGAPVVAARAAGNASPAPQQ